MTNYSLTVLDLIGFRVAKYTPALAMIKPIISRVVNPSFSNIHPMIAATGGTKKKSADVWLAELWLIKYIKIENAPKLTAITNHPIDIPKDKVNSIAGSSIHHITHP